MLGEKSLTRQSSLLLPGEVWTVLTTPSQLSASHFKRYWGSDKCGVVFQSIDDLPACFCMGRCLCLEPILPVATPVAGLWRSTCKPYAALTGQVQVLVTFTIGLEIGLLTKITFGFFLKFLLKRIFWWKPCEKFSGEVGIKCHQSCTVALVFCTKLYIKLAVSLCSFSQFSFPFNFQTANGLVLKIGKLPLRCLFSDTLFTIFDIFFHSKVIHRFVAKNGPKMTWGRVFQHNFISKANLKNPEQGCLVHRFYLLRKQNDCLWQGRFST